MGDRHGIFSELGYISIGDRYPKVELGSKPFHTSASIGKQMMTGWMTNSQSPCQAGYFDAQFSRIMANEALSDPIKEAHKERLLRKKKRIGRGIWIPSNGEKKASGSGNHYGTIGGKIPHFSAENKEKIKLEKAKANVLTNPPKKGTGYGYANVTLNPYHEHKTDPYDGPKEQRADENRDHRRRLRGKAFKLNNHPRPYFDLNPFKPTKIPQTSESMTKLNVYEKKHKPFQTTFTPCRPFHRHPAHMPNGGEQGATRRTKPYTKGTVQYYTRQANIIINFQYLPQRRDQRAARLRRLSKKIFEKKLINRILNQSEIIFLIIYNSVCHATLLINLFKLATKGALELHFFISSLVGHWRP